MNQVRFHLLAALGSICHLEAGLALCCTPIQDKDQREELLRAKKDILAALKCEEDERT